MESVKKFVSTRDMQIKLRPSNSKAKKNRGTELHEMNLVIPMVKATLMNVVRIASEKKKPMA